MKHIEVSKKVKLSRDVKEETLKQAVLERLRRAFNIENMVEAANGFNFRGTTGNTHGLTRHALVNLEVQIAKDDENARIFIHGHSKMAKSLFVLYTALFVFILLLGLMPGSIETSWDNSGAGDVLVFLIFGIFIFYDIEKKITEPGEFLSTALASIETEFG